MRWPFFIQQKIEPHLARFFAVVLAKHLLKFIEARRPALLVMAAGFFVGEAIVDHSHLGPAVFLFESKNCIMRV